MKRLLKITSLMLAMVAILSGCGGKIRYPAYYTLSVPPPPDPPAQSGTLASITVREFQSPSYLRQGPIIYRSTPEEIGFYEYHRWAADPRTLVTSAVVDHLRASGHYSSVSTYNGRSDVDYVLSGRLEKLEEMDRENGVAVEVALSAQITRVATGATVWSNSVTEAETVSQRTVPGVVSQMNRSMGVALNRLLCSVPASLPATKN